LLHLVVWSLTPLRHSEWYSRLRMKRHRTTETLG
jgi:hypothetical protein